MWNNIYTTVHHLPAKLDELTTGSKIGVGMLAVGGCYIGARTVHGLYRRTLNNKLRVTKQAHNAKSIRDMAARVMVDPVSPILVAHITELTLAELCKELKEGKIRPIQALKAYQAKALDAHQKTNCLVEAITEAEEWALALEKGPREGALWGVPISLKDDIGIKGYDSTIGMVIKVNNPSPVDAEVVKVLRLAGAVPFVKTNVPQTELTFEPGNPISGIVYNPHRHGHSPGGSSSGEAALIGSGGSILGFGSDLAGSIRVPSHFSGIYGFKPTSERISTRGMSLDAESVIPIRPVWGPMARDVDSLVTSLRTLWEAEVLSRADPECVPLPFDTKEYTGGRKLRIGYYTNNGISPTFSACVRAVNIAKDVLCELGHELVPWTPPHPAQTMELGMRVLQADGGAALRDELRYDIIHPTMSTMTRGIYTPKWIKKGIATLIHPLRPDIAEAMRLSCGSRDVYANNKLTHELWTERRSVQDSWHAAGLDVVICPPHVMAAPPLGTSELVIATCLFTFTYNVLHYPAGILPVTTVQQTDIDDLDLTFSGSNTIHQQCKQAMCQSMDLPVGVMVVAARYKDELSLRVMKVLEEGLRQKQA